MEDPKKEKWVYRTLAKLPKFQYDDQDPSDFSVGQGLVDNFAYATRMVGEDLRLRSKSREYVQTVLNECPFPCFILNKEGVMEEMNETAANRLNFRRADVLKRPFGELLGEGFSIDSQDLNRQGLYLEFLSGRRVVLPMWCVPVLLPPDWGRQQFLMVCHPLDLDAVTGCLQLIVARSRDPDLVGKVKKFLPLLGSKASVNPAMEEYGLTAHDLKVLELLAEGYSAQQISGFLGNKPRTVETQIARLRKRFGVTKSNMLVQLANDLHLIGPFRY
jgi:DNA-binding CsgD family transcriptional regulator